MSELLRNQMVDLGLKHHDIAQRARNVNQTTTYRVVEGDTQNPSLSSVTSIIEAISLTDADARVLYQKLGSYHAAPRTFVTPAGASDFTSAKIEAKNLLDRGELQTASKYVMVMFDLAQSDDEFSIAYEQAGIVYMGLGRWEEAQVNFEAADAHLSHNIDNPDTPQSMIDRKQTIMTNISSLMVKRGNISWAITLSRSIIDHERVSELNKGWALLVTGEALLERNEHHKALKSLEDAHHIFQRLHTHAVSENENRKIQQAEGNMRWTQIHLLKAKYLCGNMSAHHELRELELSWKELDPEASTMAGFFFAELTPHKKRRTILLKDLQKRAKKHHLGEALQRIASLLILLFFVNFGIAPHSNSQNLLFQNESSSSKHPTQQNRGNTGYK